MIAIVAKTCDVLKTSQVCGDVVFLKVDQIFNIKANF